MFTEITTIQRTGREKCLFHVILSFYRTQEYLSERPCQLRQELFMSWATFSDFNHLCQYIYSFEHLCQYTLIFFSFLERVDKFIVRSDITSNKLQDFETVSRGSCHRSNHTQKYIPSFNSSITQAQTTDYFLSRCDMSRLLLQEKSFSLFSKCQKSKFKIQKSNVYGPFPLIVPMAMFLSRMKRPC